MTDEMTAEREAYLRDHFNDGLTRACLMPSHDAMVWRSEAAEWRDELDRLRSLLSLSRAETTEVRERAERAEAEMARPVALAELARTPHPLHSGAQASAQAPQEARGWQR